MMPLHLHVNQKSDYDDSLEASLPILVFSERLMVRSIDSLLVLLCMMELWEVFNDCDE